MKLESLIKTIITEFLNEQEILIENPNYEIVQFLSDKKFVNPKSKMFLYHGTKISPDRFILRNDYDGEDGQGWSGELPAGYLFLTTSVEEASAYGKYIIPCELKRYDNIFFNVNANNPSQIFDKDYGIDLFKPEKYFNFWEEFEESMKRVLIIKGTNKKWTIITDSDNVIPRTDLAEQFYGK